MSGGYCLGEREGGGEEDKARKVAKYDSFGSYPRSSFEWLTSLWRVVEMEGGESG